MKLLMFGAEEFWYKTFKKTIENVESTEEEKTINNAIIVFINAEKEDENRETEVLSKAVGNIKWIAEKNNFSKIVLHPFAHLSESKSSIEFAKKIIEEMKLELLNKKFDAYTTPFGYFLEFKIHVKGESMAKVWKSI